MYVLFTNYIHCSTQEPYPLGHLSYRKAKLLKNWCGSEWFMFRKRKQWQIYCYHAAKLYNLFNNWLSFIGHQVLFKLYALSDKHSAHYTYSGTDSLCILMIIDKKYQYQSPHDLRLTTMHLLLESQWVCATPC